MSSRKTIWYHRLFEKTRPFRELPWPFRFAAATGLVLLAFAVRNQFNEPLNAFPFLLFFPALIISAVVFNRGHASHVLSASRVAPGFVTATLPHSA